MRMKIEGFIKDEHGFRHPIATMYSPERRGNNYPKINWHRRRLENWMKKHYEATDFKLTWV